MSTDEIRKKVTPQQLREVHKQDHVAGNAKHQGTIVIPGNENPIILQTRHVRIAEQSGYLFHGKHSHHIKNGNAPSIPWSEQPPTDLEIPAPPPIGTRGDTLFIRGTNSDDQITVTQGDDLSKATVTINGKDYEVSLAGIKNVIVTGNEGNDSINLSGLKNKDIKTTIVGGEGDDSIWGTQGNDHLYGGAGADQIYGLDGDDLIRAGEGNDTVYGGNGSDRISGGLGEDILYGGNGRDGINGGRGRDLVNQGDGPTFDLDLMQEKSAKHLHGKSKV